MGRRKQYFYYHCHSGCSHRVRTDLVNQVFTEQLRQWQPNPRFQTLCQAILNLGHEKQTSDQRTYRRHIARQIEQQQSRITKARELLLSGSPDPAEYQELKTKSETRLEELQVDLDTSPDQTDRYSKARVKTTHTLAQLTDYYQRANIKNKRRLVGLLFPANLVFKEGRFDFNTPGQGLQLIYQYDKKQPPKLKAKPQPKKKQLAGQKPDAKQKQKPKFKPVKSIPLKKRPARRQSTLLVGIDAKTLKKEKKMK